MAFVNRSEDSRESAAHSSPSGQKVADGLPSGGVRVTYTYDPAGFIAVRERTGIPDPRVQAQAFYRFEAKHRPGKP